MTKSVPLVDYLRLSGSPHLVAAECTACGARYFDRRNACAACAGSTFHQSPVADTGVVTAFTIVCVAAPGVEVPFVAAVVDCGGTSVKGNLVNVPADPAHVSLGMPVRLTTWSLGRDSAGTEAIGFGFEPCAAIGSAAVEV
jgi:uncharacterized OB-fold protein